MAAKGDKYVMCPICETSFRNPKDGKLPDHNFNGKHCEGSGKMGEGKIAKVTWRMLGLKEEESKICKCHDSEVDHYIQQPQACSRCDCKHFTPVNKEGTLRADSTIIHSKDTIEMVGDADMPNPKKAQATSTKPAAPKPPAKKEPPAMYGESSSDMGDPKCSLPHSKSNPDQGGGGKINGKWFCADHYKAKKKNEGENVFDMHQVKIANDTLKMHPAMAGVMGGMSHEEAHKVIKRITGSDKACALEGCQFSKYKKESLMKSKKPVSEAQYHALANAAINMMVRIQESPRAGRVTPLLARLDKVANKAADAVAAIMMGETRDRGFEFPDLFKELKECYTKAKRVMGEGWIMFPALGLGNDFNMESSGLAWDASKHQVSVNGGTGVVSLEPVEAALHNTQGTDLHKAEHVAKYVDELLNEGKKCAECNKMECECKE